MASLVELRKRAAESDTLRAANESLKAANKRARGALSAVSANKYTQLGAAAAGGAVAGALDAYDIGDVVLGEVTVPGAAFVGLAGVFFTDDPSLRAASFGMIGYAAGIVTADRIAMMVEKEAAGGYQRPPAAEVEGG